MSSFISYFILYFLLISTVLYSEELLQRREAYVLTKSSWQEVKAQEKEAFAASKQEKRTLKKQTKRKINSAEKNSARFESPTGNIFINKLYNLKLSNEFKGNILVSIDDSPEQTLDSDILILGEGYHKISYKLLDEKGNVRSEKKETVFLDLTRPEVSAQLEGVYFEKNSFYYYKPGVKLFLQVKDKESGVEDIFINLNHKGYLPMNKVDQPIDSPGPKEVKILVTDKVTNISQEVYLKYSVDGDPPIIVVELNTIPERHSDLGNVCDRNVSIRLSAFDMGFGVSKIEFRKKGQKKWRVYRDYPLIPIKKKKIAMEFRAVDNLGNESEIKTFECKVKKELP